MRIATKISHGEKLDAYIYFTLVVLVRSGMDVYIWWNGMVEWNSGMDYWNGGMLHRTYLIIQHLLYSEQYPITELVVVANRSTLSQLSLRTTYVYRIKSGCRLVPWTTGKQDLETFTSTVTYPVSRLHGQVSVRRCYTFPQVRLFSSYLPTPSSANARAIVTELFSLSDCTHTICEKEKLQFVIKCETYCGAWLPCMHQRVKLYPGLGESSKVHTVQY